MPIYEYRCRKCGKTTEIMQKFSDQPLTRCPSCSGKVFKIISNCSFQLKGSGWYVTDYKKKDSGWKDTGEAKKTETKTDENLGLQIISVLEKSDVSLYGYEIARAIGLSPKEAIRIRQPLRELVKDGKLVIDKLQLRKKEVVYYSIPDTEQFHNLMIKETEKEIIKVKWQIVSRAVHGMHMPDFVIEKNGKIFVECETGRKNSLGDFDKRVSEYESTTMIVSPNLEQKERYSYIVSVNSGKAKVCLIPEIEEVLKNW